MKGENDSSRKGDGLAPVEEERSMDDAGNESESSDLEVASPCVAALSEAQDEAIPPLITQHSSLNTLSPEMLGELRKMYEALCGVFGENGIMRM